MKKILSKIFIALLLFGGFVSPVFATTTTVYPDADPETTSVDGNTSRDVVSETFATIRAGAGNANSSSVSNGFAMNIETNATTDRYARFHRGIFLFDTSAIPDTDTITNAVFSLRGEAKSDNLSQSVCVVSANPASNTTLANSDYAITGFGSTDFATRITITSFSTTGYNDFTLNASGIANISKTSISKFGTLGSSDLDNIAPTWSGSTEGRVNVYMADETGTTKDPKLVITHSAASRRIFQTK